MGQKVNPTGFRTGIMVGWKSRWYASKAEFSNLLIEDKKLRDFVKEKYKFAGIPKIEIERTRDEVKVVLHTARPGIIRRFAPSITVSALRRVAAHSSSLAGTCSIGFPWSMVVFTAFHTTSTLGSITLFMTSLIDATG